MSLFKYSGLAAKVHAMEANMLTFDDYKTMCSISTIKELSDYLEKCPAYSNQISSLSEEEIHRVQIERQLMISMYRDFTKLYKFTSAKDRNFLNIYMVYFEVGVIKILLRMELSGQKLSHELSEFKEFFDKHSSIDINKLLKATNKEEFIESFKETEYYNIISMLTNTDNVTLFDIEMRLDMYYYMYIWKLKDKFLEGSGKASIEEIIGTEIDLLNILWIYRSKHFYDVDNQVLLAYLLPINYRLKKSQLKRLIESKNDEEFQQVLKDTLYARVMSEFYGEGEKDAEKILFATLSKLQKKAVRSYPMSLAPVKYYMYRKKTEISNITKIIEGIRYELEPKEIMSYLNISDRKEGNIDW